MLYKVSGDSMLGEVSKNDVKAKVFLALSNPTRLKIVEALSEGEKGVSQLVEELNISQSLVSHNLKTLKDCGILVSTRKGRTHLYTLRDERILDILDVSDVIVVTLASDLARCVCD